MARARCAIDVLAGVLPGTPMDEFSKRFWLTSDDWDGGSEKGQEAFAKMVQEAQQYMLTLMNPAQVNWVRFEWVWF